MIKLTRVLAPEDGTEYENINSFATEGYIGIWNGDLAKFVLIAKRDGAFCPATLPFCGSLDELDEAVYKECGERIREVSESGGYEIRIAE